MHFENYGLIDGLPDNNITHITEDTTGALWIATRNGLCKFDGNHFYKHPIPHVTSTTFVVQFGLNKQGQMQCIVNGLLYKVVNDSIIQVPYPPPFANALLSQITVTPNGDTLISTVDSKTYLMRNGVIHNQYTE